MPSVLTAVAQTDTSTPDYPDGYVGAKPTFQDLVDARAFMTGTLPTFIDWPGVFAVEGSAPNNFTVTYGAISAVVLYASNIYKPFSSGGSTANQTNVQGGGGTLGAAANWWYVYAYNNAGALGIEISTTAPNASLTLKTGDATRFYLGCFRTDGSGVPIPVRAQRGRYTFRAHQSVASGLVATSATAVSITSFVPPHARLATIEFRCTRGTAASNRAFYLYGNASGSYVAMQLDGVDIAAAVNYYITGRAEVELDSSRQFAYSIDSSSGTPSIEAFVCGWQE